MRTNTKTQAGIKDGGLYYTDDQLKRSIDMELQSTLKRFNTLKNDFETITTHKILTFDEFMKLLENPVEFYKSKHISAVENSQLFQQLKSLKLNTETLIELPEQFSTIQTQVTMINRGGTIRADRFTIIDNRIEAAAAYLERLYKRVFFYARTEAEKQRLAISQSFIDCYQKAEEHIRQHYKEKKSVNDALAKGFHANPLPYFVIKVQTKNGVELVANPKWVSGCYDSTSLLGFYIHSPLEQQRAERDSKPKLGKRHLKFRKLIEGQYRYFLIEEDKADRYRKEGNEFLPGIWNEQDKKYGTPLTPTTNMTELYLNNSN